MTKNLPNEGEDRAMHLIVRTREPDPVRPREVETDMALKLTGTNDGKRIVEVNCEARVSMVKKITGRTNGEDENEDEARQRSSLLTSLQWLR